MSCIVVCLEYVLYIYYTVRMCITLKKDFEFNYTGKITKSIFLIWLFIIF